MSCTYMQIIDNVYYINDCICLIWVKIYFNDVIVFKQIMSYISIQLLNYCT